VGYTKDHWWWGAYFMDCEVGGGNSEIS